MFRYYGESFRMTPPKVCTRGPKKYYCDLCNEGSPSKIWDIESDLDIHRRSEHTCQLWQLMKNPKNYMCRICMYKQGSRAALIAHIKTHHLLTPPDSLRVKRQIFICAYCKNLFFDKLLLSVHIVSFHLYSRLERRRSIKTTTCPVWLCKRVIKVKTIWFHFQNHFMFSSGTCPICFVVLDDYEEVLKHVETHPGYFSCDICNYETDKEKLFLSHVQTHRKMVQLVEETDEELQKVAKYFIPGANSFVNMNKRAINFFRGINLASHLQICVLCRMICTTTDEMRQHIYADHSPNVKVEPNRHMCTCGEKFFNSVLLKHHIFVKKGDHKVHDGKSQLSEKPVSEIIEVAKVDQPEPMAEIKGKKTYFLEIPSKFDLDKTSTYIPIREVSDEIYNKSPMNCHKKHETSADKPMQEQNKATLEPNKAIQEISDEEDKSAINHNEVKKEQNEATEEENEAIQEISHQEYESDTLHLDKKYETGTDKPIQAHNNATKEQNEAIQEQNKAIQQQNKAIQQQNKAIQEISDEEDKIDTVNRYKKYYTSKSQINVEEIEIKNEIPKQNIKENNAQEMGTSKKRLNDNILLNNALSKKFKSTKQFYEHVLSLTEDDIEETCTQRNEGELISISDLLQHNTAEVEVNETEWPPEAEVYEVVEVPGDSNEDSESMVIDDQAGGLFGL